MKNGVKQEYFEYVTTVLGQPEAIDFSKILASRVLPKHKDLTLQERKDILEKALVEYEGHVSLAVARKVAALDCLKIDQAIIANDYEIEGITMDSLGLESNLAKPLFEPVKEYRLKVLKPEHELSKKHSYRASLVNFEAHNFVMTCKDDVTRDDQYCEFFEDLMSFYTKLASDNLNSEDFKEVCGLLDKLMKKKYYSHQPHESNQHFDNLKLCSKVALNHILLTKFSDSEDKRKFNAKVRLYRNSFDKLINTGAGIETLQQSNKRIIGQKQFKAIPREELLVIAKQAEEFFSVGQA